MAAPVTTVAQCTCEILTMMPLVQSSGTLYLLFLSHGCESSDNSVFRLSWPGALPLFRFLITVRVSCLLNVCFSCWWISVEGLFEDSAWRTFCSFSVVSSQPYLSLMGVSLVPRYLPQTLLVILYTFPCILLAAFFARMARSSMYASLSALTILLTVGSASWT